MLTHLQMSMLERVVGWPTVLEISEITVIGKFLMNFIHKLRDDLTTRRKIDFFLFELITCLFEDFPSVKFYTQNLNRNYRLIIIYSF